MNFIFYWISGGSSLEINCSRDVGPVEGIIIISYVMLLGDQHILIGFLLVEADSPKGHPLSSLQGFVFISYLQVSSDCIELIL